MVKETGFADSKNIKLSDVLGKIDKEDASSIEKAVTGLIDAVKKIDDINAKNTHMIKNYLEYLDFTKQMKDKLDKPAEATTYAPDGRKTTDTAPKGPSIDKTI